MQQRFRAWGECRSILQRDLSRPFCVNDGRIK